MDKKGFFKICSSELVQKAKLRTVAQARVLFRSEMTLSS
jgi:hypothetical protein